MDQLGDRTAWIPERAPCLEAVHPWAHATAAVSLGLSVNGPMIPAWANPPDSSKVGLLGESGEMMGVKVQERCQLCAHGGE